MKRKGLILAGGEGTRLYPSTRVVSKHLLPVFNKPMIYYSLATMIAAKIDEIAIIIKPEDRLAYTKLLGDGSDFGVSIHFIEQENPNGLPEAYILAESFLDGKPSVLLLGDNIYFGEGLSEFLVSCGSESSSATIVGYKVSDPERFGVIEFDEDGIVKNLEEKPVRPKSDYAVTGIYFLDGDAPRFAKTLVPSNRGEIEIVDLLKIYLEQGNLNVRNMGRGYTWLDTGTYESLANATNFVRTIEERQGLLVGSPEEAAYRNNWLSKSQIGKIKKKYKNSFYADYLFQIIGN